MDRIFDKLLISFVVLNVVSFGHSANALPAPNSNLVRPDDQIDETALITKESRVPRSPDELGELESSQGRVWCFTKKNVPTQFSNRNKLRNTFTFLCNGNLIIDKDVVVLNRHNFVKMDGHKTNVRPEDCFFEHVASGEFIRFKKVQYEPYEYVPSDNYLDYYLKDFALAQLEREPSKAPATPIAVEDMEMSEQLYTRSTPLTVISNYAQNYKQNSKSPLDARETPTTTSCMARLQIVSNGAGLPTHVYFTDCNTGLGSSGSLVLAEMNGKKKPVGIIVGEKHLKKPGSGFDPASLITIVTQFDTFIMDLYKELKGESI